ncbi:MAG TPA: ATP-grasp domain-containing protein, partial [Gammaproteobacteria bacterium]|nr:ATP-grasp domain-containing protein [Gammaproteobacteria bacterium]
MLGGGQLGRMFTVAAQTMGYQVVVLDPDLRSPAGCIADQHIRAGFTDEAALDQMADVCDVVTTEFENIPASVLRHLSQRIPVHPSAEAVEITQNRIREKRFVRDIGLKTTHFAAIEGAGDITAVEADFGFPAILKVAELGYDGKGQVTVDSFADLRAAHAELGNVDCVLEQRVELALEVSVILACEKGGVSVCFPVAENIHRNGILHQTVVPADIPDALQQEAKRQ